jgi:hypothetical protein
MVAPVRYQLIQLGGTLHQRDTAQILAVQP